MRAVIRGRSASAEERQAQKGGAARAVRETGKVSDRGRKDAGSDMREKRLRRGARSAKRGASRAVRETEKVRIGRGQMRAAATGGRSRGGAGGTTRIERGVTRRARRESPARAGEERLGLKGND